jgi:hypothetical protein
MLMLLAACPSMQLAPLLPAFSGVRSAAPAMQVQGGSRRTWSYGSRPGRPDGMQFELGSDGRPVDAEFELWQGPDNTPVRTRVYGDDGYARPVYGSVGTGGRAWATNTASVRNAGPLEFPIDANIGVDAPYPPAYGRAYGRAPGQAVAPAPGPMYAGERRRIQGGALRTFTIDPSVGSVQIELSSEGMPIYGKVEVLQGPNSDRQGIELYSDDGRGKPVSYILELPGYGSTISITNTGPIAYPLTATVVPYGPQRAESRDAWHGGGAYGGMQPNQERAGSRYGRYDRYGRRGRRHASAAEIEAMTGQKWHERGQRGGNGVPRGPPPRFADMPPVGAEGRMMGGVDSASPFGAPPPSYARASDGARYGAGVY